MSECPFHQDVYGKTMQNCLNMARVEERVTTLERDSDFLKSETFEGENSIKGRLKASEVRLEDLQKDVLENRKIVKAQVEEDKTEMFNKIDEYKKEAETKISGLFRIFILTISAAFIILSAILSYLTYEVKNTNSMVVTHMLDHIPYRGSK